jgi:predicted nuclease of predicted toxin-antitoxin system
VVEAGHDVASVSDWPGDPGDAVVLARAAAEGRVLITLDKDFGALTIAKGEPHSGLVRLVGIGARQQGPTIVEILARYRLELEARAILVVEPDRVRIRNA